MINNTKILRIRHSNLQLMNNKLHFNELLFSGLAYRFTIEGVFIELLIIADGVEIGKSDDLYQIKEGLIRIDTEFEDEFEEDDPRELEGCSFWKGAHFEGGTFSFTMEGILYRESVTDYNGMDGYPSRNWFSNGLLSGLSEENGTCYSWYDNGSLSHYSKGDKKNSNYRISMNESKNIRKLYLELEDSLDYRLFNEYGVSGDLTLLGQGIRNQEFFMLIQQIEKGALQRLSLIGTLITGDFLLSIDLNGVKYITINDDEFITDSDVNALQTKYPECRVVREIY